MKKLIRFLFAMISILILTSACGERGPVGPAGPQGPPGPEILPVAFEFNADLTLNTRFEHFQDIPGQIEVFQSDVLLAFVFEEYIEEEDLEVWRKLPVTEFSNRGTQIIDYDFTLLDLRIFLHASFPLGAGDGYRDLLIRAVHIPANFAAKTRGAGFANASTYEELKAMLGREIQLIKIP
ncbi:MAG: hypothetical protein EA360_01605 [Balneolaceae bacterium]|nr:MAG: hypothetical protein EA360_01605 [Balneolaceae bacterium]